MADNHPAGFTSEQIKQLSATLDPANVKNRSQSGRRFDYIEGWHAIAEANRIFGFDGWQRETVSIACAVQSERLIGRDQKPGWSVTYTARVRVTVRVPGIEQPIIRDGSGAGHGIDVDLGLAHESALKEAETDAMKRALMTFGNPFGLALYDKEQRNVAPPPAASANLAEALKICQTAGLTEYGIRNFAAHLSGGVTELLDEVPADKIALILSRGVRAFSGERVHQLNGDADG
jgi:DNA recombination protein Rad52